MINHSIGTEPVSTLTERDNRTLKELPPILVDESWDEIVSILTTLARKYPMENTDINTLKVA